MRAAFSGNAPTAATVGASAAGAGADNHKEFEARFARIQACATTPTAHQYWQLYAEREAIALSLTQDAMNNAPNGGIAAPSVTPPALTEPSTPRPPVTPPAAVPPALNDSNQSTPPNIELKTQRQEPEKRENKANKIGAITSGGTTLITLILTAAFYYHQAKLITKMRALSGDNAILTTIESHPEQVSPEKADQLQKLYSQYKTAQKRAIACGIISAVAGGITIPLTSY